MSRLGGLGKYYRCKKNVTENFFLKTLKTSKPEKHNFNAYAFITELTKWRHWRCSVLLSVFLSVTCRCTNHNTSRLMLWFMQLHAFWLSTVEKSNVAQIVLSMHCTMLSVTSDMRRHRKTLTYLLTDLNPPMSLVVLSPNK